MVHEEVHPVEEIYLAHARICIQEQQVDVRIFLLQAFLHTLGDDVIGDAAKRLEAQHIRHAVARKGGDLTGDQPAFAILVVQVEDLLRIGSDLVDAPVPVITDKSLLDRIELAQEVTGQFLTQDDRPAISNRGAGYAS